MKEYPRIGSRSKKKPKGMCVICKEGKADARVDVEINMFRGDDDVYKVHSRCIKNVRGDKLLENLLKSD